MEHSSEVESCSLNDSISSTASSARYRECTMSPEEQSLLQLLQRGMLETNEENIAFGKEILSLLSKLNLDPPSLHSDIKEGLQKVALILRYEGLSECNDVTLSIVGERKKIAEQKKQHSDKQLSVLYDSLFRKYDTFSKRLNHIQEAVNSLEDTIQKFQKEQEDIYYNRIALSSKLKEYQQTVEKLETNLTDMQVEELYPKSILNKYNKYLEMLGELAELNQSLSQYGDLPPNLLQAKALVEVKQKEYETIEKAFLEKINY